MKPLPVFPSFGATSVSQIAVSAASIWQKNGRMLANLCCRQCWRSRAVSGVTSQSFGFGSCLHRSTWKRRSLMIGVGSYCCFAVERPTPSLKTRVSCVEGFFRLRGFGNGSNEFRAATAFNYLLRRLPLSVQFPMPGRVLIRRIENRVLKKTVLHQRRAPTWIAFRILLRCPNCRAILSQRLAFTKGLPATRPSKALRRERL